MYRALLSLVFGLLASSSVVFLGAAASAASASTVQDRADVMGSIDEYLMDEHYEIALAESGGPARIAADATVMVLRPDGLHTPREGTNGFVCLVERSWTNYIVDPSQPSSVFWSPDFIVPVCYNREAANSILQVYVRKTELALAGKSRREIKHAVDAGLADGSLRPPTAAAIGYMLSDGQRLGAAGQFVPHVMIYVPYARAADVGEDPTGEHRLWVRGEGGPWANILVRMASWRRAPEQR